MTIYKYEKKNVSIDTPVEVIELFKERIIYNSETGILYNKLTNKYYSTKTTKGYISAISIRYNNIEYVWIAHRLCWFLYKGEILVSTLQIDHINNIKSDNRIINLRKATNQQNQGNIGSTSKTSHYKGVHLTVDKKPSGHYTRYVANICYNKSMKIGRFKDAEIAAKYYDAAARYYFKEFANVNFTEEFIPTMSVEELRKYKISKKH